MIRRDHRDTGSSTSYAPGAPPCRVEDLADDAVRVLDGYGMRHLLSGSAHDCDEAAIRAMARENFDRSNNTLMSFDHGALSGGDAWLGPFGELAARSSGTGSTRISLGLE